MSHNPEAIRADDRVSTRLPLAQAFAQELGGRDLALPPAELREHADDAGVLLLSDGEERSRSLEWLRWLVRTGE